MPRRPSKTERNVKYANFCSICWLEHFSTEEHTQHCLSKEHAFKYFKLESKDPGRFARLAKIDSAFECYVCTALGKYVRFSRQSGLKMHVDSVHKAKPKNPGQKATAASFKALNSSPEYPEALKKIQSSKSRSSAHTREWELQKKERAGLQGEDASVKLRRPRPRSKHSPGLSSQSAGQMGVPTASKRPANPPATDHKEDFNLYEDVMSSFKCPMPTWGDQQSSSVKEVGSDGNAKSKKFEGPTTSNPVTDQRFGSRSYTQQILANASARVSNTERRQSAGPLEKSDSDLLADLLANLMGE